MIQLIGAIGGLIVPPVFDFLKKKFLKQKSNTPEETLGTLAVTKPEVVSSYVSAQAALLDAQTKFFNRDVIGVPSRWVVDLRASIRPLFVIGALIIRVCGWKFNWNVDDSFNVLMDVCISSWFGSRLT